MTSLPINRRGQISVKLNKSHVLCSTVEKKWFHLQPSCSPVLSGWCVLLFFFLLQIFHPCLSFLLFFLLPLLLTFKFLLFFLLQQADDVHFSSTTENLEQEPAEPNSVPFVAACPCSARPVPGCSARAFWVVSQTQAHPGISSLSPGQAIKRESKQ